jgi:hypothetical protein
MPPTSAEQSSITTSMRSVWPSDVKSGAPRILVSVDFAARVRGARTISQTTAINAAGRADTTIEARRPH